MSIGRRWLLLGTVLGLVFELGTACTPAPVSYIGKACPLGSCPDNLECIACACQPKGTPGTQGCATGTRLNPDGGDFCPSGQWCWENPQVTGNNLNAVHMISKD